MIEMLVFHDEPPNGTMFVFATSFTPGIARAGPRGSCQDSHHVGLLIPDAEVTRTQEPGLGDAARAVHAREALADQEDRVAHDRAGERDLDDDQRRGRAVPAQRREDR